MKDADAGVKDESLEQSGAKRRLRWTPRVTAMVVCAAMLYLPVSAHGWPLYVPAFSPLVSAAIVLATHTIPLFVLPAMLVALITLWQRRWFCHWVCPTGCCADGASWLGRRCGRRLAGVPAFGRALALLILSGACLGYPLLLWTDPLAFWSGAIGAGLAPSGWAACAGCAGLAIALLISFLWPHAWCARLCPLGGLQDLLAQLVSALAHTCRQCVRSSEGQGSRQARGVAPRRLFMGSALGAGWAWGLKYADPSDARPLRPPGAAPEQQFSSLCIRCGNCARACPTRVISAADLSHGIGGWLAPIVTLDVDYCLESCNRCTAVCPSGAIRFISTERKLQAVMGVPQVDMALCLLGADRECAICRNRCPYQAIRLVFDEEQYTLTPQVDLHRCPGCGACQAACPTSPRKAIVVQPLTPVSHHVPHRPADGFLQWHRYRP